MEGDCKLRIRTKIFVFVGVFLLVSTFVPNSIPLAQASGSACYWALIVAGSTDEHFSATAQYMYHVLSQHYIFDGIYYLDTRTNLPGVNANATKGNVRGAITDWLRTHSTVNDIVFIFFTSHGGGYHINEGWEGGRAEFPGDEDTEVREDHFRIANLLPRLDLRPWRLWTYVDWDGDGSSDDVIRDFLEWNGAHWVRDGFLEVDVDYAGLPATIDHEYNYYWDLDGDGNYDDFFADLNGNDQCDILIDLDTDGDRIPDDWTVDGEDVNNDGYIVGVDLNSNGNTNDWVGIDECIWLWDEKYWDDELRDDLNTLTYQTLVFVRHGSLEEDKGCFGGGLIDDISALNRIIMTASNETAYSVSWVGGYGIWAEKFIDALHGEETIWNSTTMRAVHKSPRVFVDADKPPYGNEDGKVSMLEAWNYAWENDYARQQGWETPWLDDNGNGLPTYVNEADLLDDSDPNRPWPDGDLAATVTFPERPNHDVAVVDVSTVFPLGAAAVYPFGDWYVNITVTVQNDGDFTESFDVTTRYNDNTIKTQTVNNLAPGASTTLPTFTWYTAGVDPCEYDYEKNQYLPSLSASASTVPGEVYLADNTLVDGTVTVRRLGDASGDGQCDGYDFTILNVAWLTQIGDPYFKPDVDFNGDGNIDGFDFTILNLNWLVYSEASPPADGSSKEVFMDSSTVTADAPFPAGGASMVYVDPPEVTAAVGETFTVNIIASGVERLYGWMGGLKWNPAILECTGVAYVNTLLPASAPYPGNYMDMAGTVNNRVGEIYPPYARSLSYPNVEGVNGTGALMTATFRVKTFGETWINLTNLELYNATNGEVGKIELEVTNGHFKARGVVTVTATWGADNDGWNWYPGWYDSIGRDEGPNYRVANSFSLASLPAGVHVTKVEVIFCVDSESPGSLLDIHAYNDDGQADPQTDSASVGYSRCAPQGTPYLNDGTHLRTTGVKTVDLGPQACTDVEAAKASVNQFTLAWHTEDTEYDYGVLYDYTDPTNPPKLKITYTA